MTSAVRGGYGVTFISRSSVENDLAAGTLVEARVDGLELEREILLVRAAGRSETRAARAFLEFARARRAARDRPLRARRAAGAARRGGDRAAVRDRERALARARPAARRLVDGGARRSSVEVPPRGRRDPRGRRRLRDRHRRSTRRPRPGCRSCTCRRPTPAPSGRPSSASARPTGACQGGGAARGRSGLVYDVELTLDLPRAEYGRHGAERARPLRRGALRRAAASPAGDEQALARRAADRGRRCRACSPRRTTARRARSSSPGRCTPATRSGSPGSRSRTRWRRRSAAPTALPHGAMNALCLPPALEFNRELVPDEVERFGEAIGGDAVERSARARAPRRLRAAARLRRPRGRPRRGRRSRRRPRRQPGEPAPGHRRPRSRRCYASIW